MDNFISPEEEWYNDNKHESSGDLKFAIRLISHATKWRRKCNRIIVAVYKWCNTIPYSRNSTIYYVNNTQDKGATYNVQDIVCNNYGTLGNI
jgi:hypothetical protein